MYQVPETVRAKTTKCPHDFSCLRTGLCGTRPLCRVGSADGRNVLFLDENGSRACPHRLCFGERQVCVCPTHYACHAKYGV
jgi:hypothetical protein